MQCNACNWLRMRLAMALVPAEKQGRVVFCNTQGKRQGYAYRNTMQLLALVLCMGNDWKLERW